MLKFIDLFCGIGGFRVALEEKGMECVFSSDIDKDVQEIYLKNFGEKPHGDITEISERKIPKHDILCAGFPCQPFSISGNKYGLETTNGKMFYEIVRIASYHKPYILLLENVKNIINMNSGDIIKTIKTKLDEIGYDVHMCSLNASLFGIPQARERVYFLCIRKDIKEDVAFKYSPPIATMEKIYLENILEEEVPERLYIKRDDVQLKLNQEFDNDLKPIKVGYLGKGGQGERIYSPKGHAITLSAFGGGVGAKTGLYLIDNRIRRLSLNESKTLMGFNQSHHISENTKGYQQLGNAVIPKMVSCIYESIGIKL